MTGQQAVGGVEMQAFDHAVADADRALALSVGGGEGSDDLTGPGDLFGLGGEGGVGGLDLGWMDQALAVEAEGAGLFRFGGEAVSVGDVVVDAVEDQKVVGACGGDGRSQILMFLNAKGGSFATGFAIATEIVHHD